MNFRILSFQIGPRVSFGYLLSSRFRGDGGRGGYLYVDNSEFVLKNGLLHFIHISQGLAYVVNW